MGSKPATFALIAYFVQRRFFLKPGSEEAAPKSGLLSWIGKFRELGGERGGRVFISRKALETRTPLTPRDSPEQAPPHSRLETPWRTQNCGHARNRHSETAFGRHATNSMAGMPIKGQHIPRHLETMRKTKKELEHFVHSQAGRSGIRKDQCGHHHDAGWECDAMERRRRGFVWLHEHRSDRSFGF